MGLLYITSPLLQGLGQVVHEELLWRRSMKCAEPHCQSNRVGQCISRRSLVRHEHFPVCFDDVSNGDVEQNRLRGSRKALQSAIRPPIE